MKKRLVLICKFCLIQILEFLGKKDFLYYCNFVKSDNVIDKTGIRNSFSQNLSQQHVQKPERKLHFTRILKIKTDTFR